MTFSEALEYFDFLSEKVLLQKKGNLISALEIEIDNSLFVEQNYERFFKSFSALFRSGYSLFALYRKYPLFEKDIKFYKNKEIKPAVEVLKQSTEKFLARLDLFGENTYLFIQQNLEKEIARRLSPFKLFFSRTDLKELFEEAHTNQLHFLQNAVENLSSIEGVYARPLSTEEIISLLYALLQFRENLPNIKLNENLFLTHQLASVDFQVEGSFIKAGDRFATVLSLSTLPPETFPDFFGFIREVPCGMWITQCFNPISSSLLSLRLGPLTNAAEKLAVYSFLGPLSEKARRFAEMNRKIFEKIEGGEVPLEFSFYLVLFGKDKKELEEIREKIIAKGLEEKAGFVIETLNLIPAFLSSIPGNSSFDARRKVILSQNACDFFCSYKNREGHEKAIAYFITPQRTLFKIDPFSSDLPAWNFYVVGSTGAGKSFFMNYILMNSLVYDPYVFILDYGESYKTVAEFLNVPVLTLTGSEKDDIQVNPFAIKKFDEQTLQYLVLFVESLVKQGEEISLEERVDISEAIKTLFIEKGAVRNNELPPDFDFPTLSDLYTILKEINQKLAKRLKLWLKGELYGRYFDHKKDNFSFSKIQYIEMSGFDKDERLASPLIFSLFYKIFETITTIPPGQKKLILMDEVWKFLLNKTMAEKTQEIFRTIRKFGGLIGIITQHPTDLLNSEYRDAILANIYVTYFLRQERVYEEWRSTFSMNEREFEEIKNLQIVKGKYSEIMFWSGKMKKKLRLTVNPLLYWMFTTNPYEKEKRSRFIEKYGLKEGLIKLVEEEMK